MANVAATLRSRLAQSRAEGTTLHAVSNATGVNVNILYRFLDDPKRDMAVSTADKLLEYFGLSLSGGEPPPPPHVVTFRVHSYDMERMHEEWLKRKRN